MSLSVTSSTAVICTQSNQRTYSELMTLFYAHPLCALTVKAQEKTPGCVDSHHLIDTIKYTADSSLFIYVLAVYYEM